MADKPMDITILIDDREPIRLFGNISVDWKRDPVEILPTYEDIVAGTADLMMRHWKPGEPHGTITITTDNRRAGE